MAEPRTPEPVDEERLAELRWELAQLPGRPWGMRDGEWWAIRAEAGRGPVVARVETMNARLVAGILARLSEAVEDLAAALEAARAAPLTGTRGAPGAPDAPEPPE